MHLFDNAFFVVQLGLYDLPVQPVWGFLHFKLFRLSGATLGTGCGIDPLSIGHSCHLARGHACRHAHFFIVCSRIMIIVCLFLSLALADFTTWCFIHISFSFPLVIALIWVGDILSVTLCPVGCWLPSTLCWVLMQQSGTL